jgi:pectate lyase
MVIGLLAASACTAPRVVEETGSKPVVVPTPNNEPSADSTVSPIPDPGTVGETDPPAETTEPALPLPTIRLVTDDEPGGFAQNKDLTGGLGQETFVVTSAKNSGDGTYRHALREGQRYIVFDDALDGETIDLDEPVIASGSDITIDGSGVDITISGRATRFSGTNIVVAGMTYRDLDGSDNEDALTFLEPSDVQVFGLYNNVFASATDGLVDLIWNRGNDVYATMCGNRFEAHDKAVLINSGREGREGGRYHVTMCHNLWNDVYQRTPLSRFADVHQYNSVFQRYGKPNGDGGGSKAGGDSSGERTQHLLESNVAVPRAIGETTFDGSEVTSPRTEWAGIQQSGSGEVKATGTLLATTDGITATENEQDPDLVFDAPYDYPLVAATPSMAEVVAAAAGRCVPTAQLRVVPCALLTFVSANTTLTARVDGVASTVEVLLDGVVVTQAIDVGDGVWEAQVDEQPGSTAVLTMRAVTSDGQRVESNRAFVGFVD